MNNIYVETMPSACGECPCCNSDVDYGACCNLCAYGFEEYYCTNQKHPNCPLKPLSDALAEERKKVVQEIWKEFEQRLMGKTKDMPIMKVCNMINSVLDKIERDE